MKTIRLLSLCTLAIAGSAFSQETPVDDLVIQTPVMALLGQTGQVAPNEEPSPETSEPNAQEAVQPASTEPTEHFPLPKYKRFAPAKIPGYTLRSLDETKTVRFNIEGQRVEIEVPILIYLPDSGGIVSKSSDLTNQLGKEILEVISANSASINPDAKLQLTKIAASLDELSKGLERSTPNTDASKL